MIKNRKNKVLVVSLWGNRNFGNKLQNYALVKILEKMKCFVVVSKNDEPITLYIKFKQFVKLCLGLMGSKRFKHVVNEKIREKNFIEFSQLYIKKSIFVKKFTLNKKQQKFINDEIDYAITGSDQVWHNWYNLKSELEYYYLTFVPSSKRISYAASFGFEEFPEQDKSTHKECLSKMNSISLREKSGKKMVESLVKKECCITLDPTLCLSKEEWECIERKPRKMINEKYILCYFLGEMTEEYQHKINNFAETNKLKIINIQDRNSVFFGIGPAEFVWLIHHTEYIFTDSFHATVFSILFEKDFMVFERIEENSTNMYDRIKTLLMLTRLEKCEYKNALNNSYGQNIDFEMAKRIIEKERKKSLEYLYEVIV